MKGWVGALIWLGLVAWPGARGAGEKGSEQARQDHALLRANPESATNLERFEAAWLDAGTRAGLMEFLVRRAREGEAVDWRILASFFERGGREEEALGALDNAVEKSPDDPALRLARSRVQARLLNFEEALADLQHAGPVTAENGYSVLRGLYLLRSGRPREAVAVWGEALAARPFDEELHEDLIELEVAEGLFEEALEKTWSLLAITRDPDKKVLRRLMQGDILLLLGRREEALKLFHSVLEDTVDGSWLEREVLVQVERVFAREEDPDGFWNFYTRIRKEFPGRVGLRRALADRLAARGDVDEAAALFREVIQSAPGDRHIHGKFVDLLEGVGLFEEAVGELEILVSKPGGAAWFDRLTALYHRMGDRRGVEDALSRMLASANQDGGPAGLLRVARLLKRYQLVDRSGEVLLEACRKHPGNAELNEALASFLAVQGRGEEAVALWGDMARDAGRDGLLAVSRSLSAHGFVEDAFTVLQNRVPEFGRDASFLRHYCEAGVLARRGEEVWREALLLTRLAQTPDTLDKALAQALTVARQVGVESLVEDLEQLDSPGERCLLAALLGQLGFDEEALDILAAAEKKEGQDGKRLLVERRVRLLEQRGDLVGAAEAMRFLVAYPGEDRSENLLRLVDLLTQDGRTERALQVVRDWQDNSPDDRVASRRAVELLQQLGRDEEAARELRRAVSRFGPGDEDSGSALARFLVEAGELREAGRIYRTLYEEAQQWEAKSRWIGSLMELARREGREDELVEEFEIKKRANPRQVGPLLVLAACYQGLGDFDGEQEALLDAVRRSPTNVHLIAELASAAERNGDRTTALRWRRAAVRLDDSPASSRRLAEYYFRQGEMELGLARLAEGGEGLPDPRDAERTLQNLARNKEWRVLLEYLATQRELVAGDWRLRYLQGVALAESGRGAEARVLFDALLDPRAELPGLQPLLSAGQLRAMGNTTSEVVAAEWDFYGAEIFDHQAGVREVALPGSVRELRWMALRQLLVLMDPGEEEEALLDARLAGLGWQEARFLLMPSADVLAYFHAELEARPDDLELLARAVEWTATEEELDPKWLKKAAAALEGRWARQGETARLALVLRRANRAENLQAALLGSLDRVDKRTRDWILEWFGQNAFNPGSEDLGKELQGKVAGQLRAHLLNVPRDYWEQHWWWVGQFIHHLVRAEDFPGAITLLNRIAGDFRSHPIQAAGSVRGSFPAEFLILPPFPARGTEYTAVLLSALTEGEGAAESQGLTARQVALLGELGYAPPGGSKELNLESMSAHLQAVEDDYLRIVLWQLCGQQAQIEVELASLVRKGDLKDLLTAAGYAAKRGRLVECYQQLVRARNLQMDRAWRVEVDGHIVAVAAAVVEKDRANEIDLEHARRAALRLRRSCRDQEQAGELAWVMEAIGMEEERSRLLRPRATRVRMGGPGRFTPQEEVTPLVILRALILRNQRQKVVLAAARELRKAFSAGSWTDEGIVDLVKEEGLEREVLAQLDPGEAQGLKQRNIYWQACVAFGQPGKALPVLRKLAGDQRGDQELRRQLILLLPPAEQGELVRAALKAGNLEEVASLYPVVAEQATDKGEEAMFLSLELLAEVLEQIEPSGDRTLDLSFALHYARRAFERWDGSVSLPGLGRPRRTTEDGLTNEAPGARGGFSQWKRRMQLAERVGQAALRHPQLALPVFRLFHGCRAGLGRGDGDFIAEARRALAVASEWRGEPSQRLRPWSTFSEILGPPRYLGMPAATYLAHRMRKDKKLADELVELVLKSDPNRSSLLQLIVATAAEDEDAALKAVHEWAGGLPDDVGMRANEVAGLLGSYLVLVPEEDEVTKIVMRQVEDPELLVFLAGEHASQCHELLRWGKSSRGTAGVHALLARFAAAAIGAEEIWAACGELAADDALPQELREYLEPFQELMKVALEGGSVSLEVLAFLLEKGLTPVAAMEDCEVMRGVGWQLQKATVEEVVAEFEAVGLWSDEGYRLWAAEIGRNLETFYEQLPASLRVGNLDGLESCRALGQLLMAAEGENTFLKRLVGARLADDNDARPFVVTQLRKQARALLKLPERTLRHLAVLVRIWIPEMRIPRSDRETAALLEMLSG